MCRATVALLAAPRQVRLDLRRPHLDQRELGGDEEAVEQHHQEGEWSLPTGC
jgi:hypothetical protein